jgi:hypothetical protein
MWEGGAPRSSAASVDVLCRGHRDVALKRVRVSIRGVGKGLRTNVSSLLTTQERRLSRTGVYGVAYVTRMS